MAELSKSNSVEETREFILAKVEEHGFAILSGSVPQSNGAQQYAYTVGLTLQGWPELYIEGVLTHEVLGIILNRQIERFAEAGPAEGEYFGVVPGADGKLRSMLAPLVAQPVIEGRAHFLGWWQTLNPEYDVALAQVLWPDPAGLLPTDEGFNHLGYLQEHRYPARGAPWHDLLLSKAHDDERTVAAMLFYVNAGDFIESYLAADDRDVWLTEPSAELWADVFGPVVSPFLVQQAMTFIHLHPEGGPVLELADEYYTEGGDFYDALVGTRRAMRAQLAEHTVEPSTQVAWSPTEYVVTETLDGVTKTASVNRALHRDAVPADSTYWFLHHEHTGLTVYEFAGLDQFEFPERALGLVLPLLNATYGADTPLQTVAVGKVKFLQAGARCQLQTVTDGEYTLALEGLLNDVGLIVLEPHGLYDAIDPGQRLEWALFFQSFVDRDTPDHGAELYLDSTGYVSTRYEVAEHAFETFHPDVMTSRIFNDPVLTAAGNLKTLVVMDELGSLEFGLCVRVLTPEDTVGSVTKLLEAALQDWSDQPTVSDHGIQGMQLHQILEVTASVLEPESNVPDVGVIRVQLSGESVLTGTFKGTQLINLMLNGPDWPEGLSLSSEHSNAGLYMWFHSMHQTFYGTPVTFTVTDLTTVL